MRNGWDAVPPSRTELRRTVVAIVLSLTISGVVWGLVVTFHVV